MSGDDIKKIQTLIGVVPDGRFGPHSRAALAKADKETIRQVQLILVVSTDGYFGPVSQGALDSLIKFVGGVIASSFADPADLAGFKRCKARGHSDSFCFTEGDNGIGAAALGGYNTATTEKKYAALPASVIRAKYGSLAGGRDKRILVTNLNNGDTVECVIGDFMSPHLSSGAEIDLNPGALLRLGVEPPCLFRVHYQFLD